MWRRLLESFEEYLCFEHCRICREHCPAHAENWQKVKAVCTGCWRQFSRQAPTVHQHAAGDGISFPVISAAGYEGDLKGLIYKLKYDSDLLLASDFAELLMNAWLVLQDRFRAGEPGNPIILVPIPLHRKRFKSRGFNQSELLAEALSAITRLPVDAVALKRVKNTQAQHDLGKAERMLNLQGAFAGNQKRLSGKTVVLIDDIYTSGATLSAAAGEVLEAGACRVAGLTVAAALPS